MNRREFIETSVLATSALTLPSFLINKNTKRLGLQLYSLRDVILKNVAGTLKQVASFGYQELETYGYANGKLFGLPIQEFEKMVSDLGMKITSGHFDVVLFPEWERAVDDAKSVGYEYMVVPSLPASDRSSLDSLKKICEQMNKKAEVCKRNGIHFGYHNHADEFVKIENKTIYDWMLSDLDPRLVSMELDLYWVAFAGYDPIKLLEAHPGRFHQWHVKDMNKIDRKPSADVGTGSIDFKPIFAKAKKAGLKHFYIEQDAYPVSPIESIKVSAKNAISILRL